MNKFLPFAMMLVASLSVSADNGWEGYFADISPTCVQFMSYEGIDDSGRPVPRHQPARLPVLGYYSETFVLSVPYELEDVTIVIRNEDGTVLYYETVATITDYYMFQLDTDLLVDLYSIELYYGDRHLYGEF